MTLQIKSMAGELGEDQKKYLRKKFLWFEEHFENNVVLTVGVKQHITKKSNQAFEVILHAIVPKMKKPFYVRVFRNDFNEAVDIARDKMERVVLKRKDKNKRFRFKLPSINVFKKGER
jgi:ribosome-associated translation inhibitor RaiA